MKNYTTHKPHSSSSRKTPTNQSSLPHFSPPLTNPNPTLSRFSPTASIPQTPIDETTLTQETHNSSLVDIKIEIPIRNLFIPRIRYFNTSIYSSVEGVKTEDCLSEGFPEFALVDRSNVGKSSLLNSLVR
ncbi:hypothetical protein RJ641_006003 [Dillenia turbinata]|uniref:G domain-containing protein n=1 Tax=Dillenia turbinata TaxID=194707 RepID=A0AAN8VDQ8_9MAGN